jgi:hypothetical protein
MDTLLQRLQIGLQRRGAFPAFDTSLLRAVLLLVIVVFILLRNPRLVSEGRFWAEEASYYFYVAWHGDFWSTLVQPFNGYYSFFNWIASGLAVQVPLEYAPLVTSGCALLVMLIPSVIILFAPLTIPIAGWRRCLLAFLLAFPNNNGEVWLNIINSQFWFALAVSLLLLVDLRGKRSFFFSCILVLVAGLTGPVSVILAPLFCLRAWLTKHRHHIVVAALLTAGALLQASIMYMALSGGERGTTVDHWINGTSSLMKLFLFPFFQWYDPKPDDPVALERLRWLYLIASLAVAAFMLYWAAATRERRGLWILAAALLVGTVSSFGAFPSALDDINYQSLRYFSGGRYHLVGNGLILTLLLLPLQRPRRFSSLFAALLLVIFANNALTSYLKNNQRGPNWREEVAIWRSDPDHAMNIWPRGWTFKLDPHYERNPPSGRKP